jgi:diguanylate cyclase (GGDEF)-like protein
MPTIREPRPFRSSLKARVLAFALLCVAAPLLAVGAYLLERSQEILGEKVRETLGNQLFRKTDQIDDWMRERQRDAARWSASFVVYEAVESLSRPGRGAGSARRDLKDYLEAVLAHYRAYESLLIVDTAGNVLAATQEERLDDWGRELLAAGPVTARVGPLRRSEFLGRPSMLVLHPIQDRSNRTSGYFVERLDLRELESLLAPPQSDPGLAFWLLDEAGRVLARAGRVEAEPGKEPFPAPLGEGRQSVREAAIAGLGPSVYATSALDGPFQGRLAAALPAAIAYRPLEESRNRILKFGIPALILVFALNFLAAGRLLRGILHLSEGAQRVAAGDLDVYLPVRGRDEISDLTRAFNDMARNVREGRLSLERARDELARSNEGLKAANRTLEALAITDGLTGLYNHRHFQETLEKEIRRSEREGRTLSVLLLDLDHFKQYNDRFGHTEGDAALRRVAGHITRTIRATDLAFRYGGEEMAVLLPSCSKQQATDVSEKLRQAVARTERRPGVFGPQTTVSVGVATFPEDGRVARGLVDAADAALYQAKSQGRNRVVAAGVQTSAEGESAG